MTSTLTFETLVEALLAAAEADRLQVATVTEALLKIQEPPARLAPVPLTRVGRC